MVGFLFYIIELSLISKPGGMDVPGVIVKKNNNRNNNNINFVMHQNHRSESEARVNKIWIEYCLRNSWWYLRCASYIDWQELAIIILAYAHYPLPICLVSPIVLQGVWLLRTTKDSSGTNLLSKATFLSKLKTHLFHFSWLPQNVHLSLLHQDPSHPTWQIHGHQTYITA